MAHGARKRHIAHARADLAVADVDDASLRDVRRGANRHPLAFVYGHGPCWDERDLRSRVHVVVLVVHRRHHRHENAARVIGQEWRACVLVEAAHHTNGKNATSGVGLVALEDDADDTAE